MKDLIKTADLLDKIGVLCNTVSDDETQITGHWTGTLVEMKEFLGRDLSDLEVTCLSLSRGFGPTPMMKDGDVSRFWRYVFPDGNQTGYWLSWGELRGNLIDWNNILHKEDLYRRKDMKEITTTQELERAIESIDFTDLHKVRIENESGVSVWLYWDGEKVHTELHTQGTIPGNENAAFAFFRCGLDDFGYEEGWATENGDGTFTTDDGRTISRSEMIVESIEVGEMSDTYDDWKDQIREDWE